MNPAMIERLKAVENQAEAMGRGARSAYLKQQAQELGISLATLYRKLEAVSVKPTRKRRSDAGKTELKPEEAKLISAVLVEAMRRNGKRLMSVRQAVEMLRANGKIEAARIDEETGEVVPLSENTITRALREYKLHPDQLLQPDPVSRMKSEHPNHCWQDEQYQVIGRGAGACRTPPLAERLFINILVRPPPQKHGMPLKSEQS